QKSCVRGGRICAPHPRTPQSCDCEYLLRRLACSVRIFPASRSSTLQRVSRPHRRNRQTLLSQVPGALFRMPPEFLFARERPAMTSTTRRQRLRLTIGGIVLTLLLAAVFTLGSLDTPLEFSNLRAILTLYAVTCFITALLLIFLLILVRTFLRLSAERSREHLGARFKTKMVIGAMAISVLPVFFMFLMSYALLNRTLARWFPRPLEIAAEQSGGLIQEMGKSEFARLTAVAQRGVLLSRVRLHPGPTVNAIPCGEADASWLQKPDGSPELLNSCDGKSRFPVFKQKVPSGADLWSLDGQLYIAAGVPDADGAKLYAARRVPNDFALRLAEIQLQTAAYDQEKQHLRALKSQLLLILVFITVLLFSSLMWLALSLAKQVTVPIQ